MVRNPRSMPNPRLLKRRFLTALLSACIVVVGLGPATGTPDENAQIVRMLRPDQREYLEIAARNGSATLVSYNPPPRPGSRIPRHSLASQQPRRRHITVLKLPLALPPAPRIRPVVVAVHAFAVDRPDCSPTTSASFVHRLRRSRSRSRYSNRRHRISAAISHGSSIIGSTRWMKCGPPASRCALQVEFYRSISGSGPFHGVRTLNGYSAIRAQVSIRMRRGAL